MLKFWKGYSDSFEKARFSLLVVTLSLRVIDCVHPHYRNCLTILFFTGLRFGEMAALKWKNVDLIRKAARIFETLVYGEEGRPKTKKSNRHIDLLPPS